MRLLINFCEGGFMRAGLLETLDAWDGPSPMQSAQQRVEAETFELISMASGDTRKMTAMRVAE